MNRRFLVAVVVGIMAILVAMNMAPKTPADKVGPQPVRVTQPVVIYRAAIEIKAKTEITPDMIRAFETFDTDEAWIKLGGTSLTSEAAIIGKVATTRIRVTEPITTQNITEKTLFVPKRLSEAIPPGKRAITIAVSVIQSVGGFIREGDYVDIVGIFSDKTMTEPIRTILSGVQVLSIGSELPTGQGGPVDPKGAGGPGEPQTSIKATPATQITFAATPEESEIITLVSNSPQKMTFSLLLRSKTEFDTSALRETAEGGTKEIIMVNGSTKEIVVSKKLTKKEAIEIFAGKQEGAAAAGKKRMTMDPRDPNFNPDLMTEDPGNQGGSRQPRSTQQNAQKPAAPAVVQPVEIPVEMYKGTTKTVINVK